MRRYFVFLFSGLLLSPLCAQQLQPLRPSTSATGPTLVPMQLPTLSKGQLKLIELEAAFAADVAKVGGKAFAT
ncbi:MAG: hypothetical protein ABI142_07490, partial [Bryocella sp.]